MEDTPDSPQQTPPGVGPGLERTFVRLALWQNVLAVIGILVGAIALYAAITESAAVRQQTAASVWPFLQLTIDDHVSAEDANFSIRFTNVGVGPARVGQLRLVIAGQPVRNLAELAGEAGALEDISRNFISNRVVSPGESITMLSTRNPERVRYFQRVVADAESSLSYCYCSIFDECWLVESRRNPHQPEPVEHCPEYGESSYNQEV